MNEFLQKLTEAEGSPQDKLFKFFDKHIGANNSKKYWSGISLLANKLLNESPILSQTTPLDEEEISYNGDNSRTIKRDIEMSEEEASSPVSIMTKMGFNPLLWQVLLCKVIRGRWGVTMKLVNSKLVDGKVVKSSTPEQHTNYKYSVTLTVKPLTDKLTGEAIQAVFSNIKMPKLPEYTYDDGNKLLEIPLLDFHLGKLAISAETGFAAYDMQIAEKLYKDSIIDILSKVNAYGFDVEEIIFPVGQDFFHIDTPSGTTTGGTPLDVSSNWQNVFAKGMEILVWTVEALRVIAPIKIMYVAGNHDEMLSYCALVGLSQIYKDCKDVDVNISPTARKYFSYGKCLVGYSHGREEGRRIAGIMQIEVPELWGESQFREWHLGDVHHEESKEDGGIIFRRISSISSPDSWHAKKGYVGTQRRANAFVWDKENGLETIIVSTVRE